ncbi:MAG: ABC transporter permease [Terrimicrobiaceae bacterium]|nr:ABC transporter permease [Terrimicrobiaceae bacterium]
MTAATTTAKVPVANAPDSPIRRVARAFFRDRVAVVSVILIALFFATAIVAGICQLAGWPMPQDPNQTHLERKLLPPNAVNWLGTDNLGRDVLSRMVAGSTISLTVGFVAMAVSIGVGIVVGAVAGYLGGWVDNVLMRIVDALLCFPSFFLILTAIALIGPNLWIIVIVIGLVGWTGTARLVRAEFLTLRESEYVRAARAMGQSRRKIIFRHILPNAFAPIFVTAVISIPDAILIESGLSFLSFGVPPPQATWGNIIADGKTYILDAWWLVVFPGLAIFIASLAFYLAGDALRRAADTRSR